ncbi:hypothetical protein [Polymorphospora sp. NPDC050346]|uniref:hypothetical protein n=1 Tax=Polymorphospora sp. NPDC050346 TaxID=3155780 RepID=UPI0033FA640D
MESAMPPVQPGQRSAYGPGGSMPRVRRLRLVLSVLGGMIALLCVGGAGVVYVAYDTVTQPDRSAPDVVVSSYLRAVFVERDEVKAAIFTCPEAARLAPLLLLRADLLSREQEFGTQFNVSWGSLGTAMRDEFAEVTLELKISAVVDGFEQSDLQDWRFELAESDSWRVCAATENA